jgi:hypothetical protein
VSTRLTKTIACGHQIYPCCSRVAAWWLPFSCCNWYISALQKTYSEPRAIFSPCHELVVAEGTSVSAILYRRKTRIHYPGRQPFLICVASWCRSPDATEEVCSWRQRACIYDYEPCRDVQYESYSERDSLTTRKLATEIESQISCFQKLQSQSV